jgi:ABC-type transport system involved in multi-copper enzyme maturation permease subunit
LIPLLAGILLNVIIIAVSAIVPLDGSALTRIGVLSLSSMLYVAGFVSLGIFVSSITRESATSLVVLLLSWAMLVIVIPGVGGIITSRMVHVPSFEEVNMNSWAAAHRAREKYLDRHPEMRGIAFGSGWWSPRENLAGPMARFEARNDVWKQYGDKMIRQVRIGQNATRVSPLGIYRHAAEALAGTGINHYDSFAKQVRRYREFLKGILMDRYPLNPHEDYNRSKDLSEKFRKAMSEVEFELSDVPEFREEPIAFEAAAKAFIWDIFFLSMFLLFFLMGSVMAFLKYDVR